MHFLNGVVGAVHIDAEDVPPEVLADILKLPLLGNAGVVDQHLHGPELRLHQPDGGGDGPPVRHIPPDCQSLMALDPELRSQSLRLLSGLEVVDAHGAALRRQPPDNGPANAPAPAGDKRGFFHPQQCQPRCPPPQQPQPLQAWTNWLCISWAARMAAQVLSQ